MSTNPEVYLEPCRASKMKHFVKMIHGYYYFGKTIHLRCLTDRLIDFQLIDLDQ